MEEYDGVVFARPESKSRQKASWRTLWSYVDGNAMEAGVTAQEFGPAFPVGQWPRLRRSCKKQGDCYLSFLHDEFEAGIRLPNSAAKSAPRVLKSLSENPPGIRDGTG